MQIFIHIQTTSEQSPHVRASDAQHPLTDVLFSCFMTSVKVVLLIPSLEHSVQHSTGTISSFEPVLWSWLTQMCGLFIMCALGDDWNINSMCSCAMHAARYSSYILHTNKRNIITPLPATIVNSRELSRVKHEYLHTLCTCVSFSWVQTISSSTVKTLKYCVMLTSAVFLTSCTSWPSLQNRVWTGSLCQRAMSPALSFCHQLALSLLLGP